MCPHDRATFAAVRIELPTALRNAGGKSAAKVKRGAGLPLGCRPSIPPDVLTSIPPDVLNSLYQVLDLTDEGVSHASQTADDSESENGGDQNPFE